MTAIGHGIPRRLWRFGGSFLQQLDGNIIGGTNESHIPVAGRPIDRHAGIDKALAGCIDIIDSIGQMTEIASFIEGFCVPIMGQFDFGLGITGGVEENQGKSPSFAVFAARFDEAESVAEEGKRGVDIVDPNHRVQIFHESRPWLLGVFGGNRRRF